MGRVRNFLCSIGFHSPRDQQDEWCVASLYRRETCGTCGDISYFVIGFGGIDRLDFVPTPWAVEEDSDLCHNEECPHKGEEHDRCPACGYCYCEEQCSCAAYGHGGSERGPCWREP